MKFNRFTVFAIALIVALLAVSCSLDPWSTGNKFPNLVKITKTTKFSKAADGVSPMKSQLGVVIFSHKTHEDMGMKCIQCHHKKNNDAREKRCAVCHKGDDGYEKLHGLCVDCHIAKGDGPQKCFECH